MRPSSNESEIGARPFCRTTCRGIRRRRPTVELPWSPGLALCDVFTAYRAHRYPTSATAANGRWQDRIHVGCRWIQLLRGPALVPGNGMVLDPRNGARSCGVHAMLRYRMASDPPSRGKQMVSRACTFGIRRTLRSGGFSCRTSLSAYVLLHRPAGTARPGGPVSRLDNRAL